MKKYYKLPYQLSDQVLNFNILPNGSGKIYYEKNKSWKYTKRRIKQILDETQKCQYTKILEIESLLEIYKNTYLK